MDQFTRDDNPFARPPVNHAVKLARTARMVSQVALARSIGVSQTLVSMWEDGERLPSEDQIESLSVELHFPPEFFSRAISFYGPAIGEVFHRRKQVSVKVRDSYYAWASIKSSVFSRMLDVIDWPDERVPTFEVTSKKSPGQYAAAARALLGIHPGPIDSMSDVLAMAGVLVVPEWHGLDALEGMSVWRNGEPPTIFVNANMPEDRIRFTLAHELGHLVLHHRSEIFNLSELIEDEAHEFASEFLMPAEEIRNHLRRIDHQALVPLKRKWKVSRGALLMRAKTLGTVPESELRSMWRDMSRRGWKKTEPDPLPRGIEDISRTSRELIALNNRVRPLTSESIPRLFGISQRDFIAHIQPRDEGAPKLLLVK